MRLEDAEIPPLERAARALFMQHVTRLTGSSSRRFNVDWVRLDPEVKAEFVADARAALQAIHEPSSKMQQAAAALGGNRSHHVAPDEIWGAMIAAALEKES